MLLGRVLRFQKLKAGPAADFLSLLPADEGVELSGICLCLCVSLHDTIMTTDLTSGM